MVPGPTRWSVLLPQLLPTCPPPSRAPGRLRRILPPLPDSPAGGSHPSPVLVVCLSRFTIDSSPSSSAPLKSSLPLSSSPASPASSQPVAVHFWAPTFKWGISIANVADFAKPPEKISYPQQVAVACTGIIWSRYSLVITPKNWNLFSVNVAMASTGLYQLSRKIRQDYFSDEKETAASHEG